MVNVVAGSVNEAWRKLIVALSEEGNMQFPRGLRSKELINVSVEISNPKKRIVSNPLRKISLPFAFGEMMWYLSAKNDLGTMEYYSRNMGNFSDDGLVLNSAYGYRIFGKHEDIRFNQWEHVVTKLREDSETRQAIIHLHTPNDKPTKDEVCTLTLQFLIRDGRLDMIVNMRSNDVVWGFTYDAFNFTVFQELIANELGIDVGTYYHNAASMHIYEKDFDLLTEVCNPINTGIFKALEKYEEELSFEGITLHDKRWKHMRRIEKSYRLDGFAVHEQIEGDTFNLMVEVFKVYAQHKHGGKVTFDFKYDNIYHNMLLLYLNRNESTSRTIIEGVDGSGKSTKARKLAKAHEILLGNDIRVIHFDKPKESFNPLVYAQFAFMNGRIIFDRSFISEIVYSRIFGRKQIMPDVFFSLIDQVMHERNTVVLLLNGEKASVYHSRLNDDDKALLSEGDIENLMAEYEKVTGNLKMNLFKSIE